LATSEWLVLTRWESHPLYVATYARSLLESPPAAKIYHWCVLIYLPSTLIRALDLSDPLCNIYKSNEKMPSRNK
ncbi:hypothetical protein ACIQYS_22195, partial [Psychrobacillus sp. NPDC096426]|uniref:hypothetical protein n=1 Tax=Psychrobacillus sp. NPDC096426 TaxID=3364491 RepID=UPI0037F64E67